MAQAASAVEAGRAAADQTQPGLGTARALQGKGELLGDSWLGGQVLP